MNRHDLLTLQAHRGSPAVSLLMPTHRTSPDAKRDPIVLKNLLLEAEGRLTERLGARAAAPLVKALNEQAAAVELRHARQGLGIFVADGFATTILLDAPVEARLVIDDSFATRDLARDMTRAGRYWLLALAESPTRLYLGIHDTLEEVRTGGFPIMHTGPGATESLPELSDKAPYEEARLHHFLERVEAAFAPFARSEPLPLALVGVERAIAHYRAVAPERSVIAQVTGSHDATPVHTLGPLVWRAVEPALATEREQALDALDAAVGAQRVASGLTDVWRHATSGRGDTLLLEEGYRQAARRDADDDRITLLDDPDAGDPDALVDAVDDAIERVLAHRGRVVFVPDGALKAHERVALTLRY